MGDPTAHNLVRLFHSAAGMEFPEIQRLRGCHAFDSQHAVSVVQDLGILDRRIHAHGNEILLIGGSRDRSDGGGSGQYSLLHNERIRSVLAQHQAGEHPCAFGQECRQSNAERRVGEPVQAPFRKHTDHGHRRPDQVHGKGDRSSLEIGASQSQLRFRQEDRIVSTPLSSVSTCRTAYATASCAAPMTWGVDLMEYASWTLVLILPASKSLP